MRLQHLTLLFFVILVLVSCGDGSGGGNGNSSSLLPQTNPLTQEMENNKTIYLAVLEPLNENVAGPVTGAVTISIDGDLLVGDVRISGSAANIIHSQDIHLKDTCPTGEEDLNQDGYIDIIEVYKHSGPVIIPLDGDLNTQSGESGMYPVADPWGTYIYSELASLHQLLTDLRLVDDNIYDGTVKWPLDSIFNFENKVVVIHGVADDIILPESVESMQLLSPQQTLPIACGTLNLVTRVPGIKEEEDRTVGRIRRHSNPISTRRQDPRVPIRPQRGPERGQEAEGDSAQKPSTGGKTKERLETT